MVEINMSAMVYQPLNCDFLINIIAQQFLSLFVINVFYGFVILLFVNYHHRLGALSKVDKITAINLCASAMFITNLLFSVKILMTL
jgi:hypothetical protein